MILTKRQENIIAILTFLLFYCSIGYYCKNILPEKINILICTISISGIIGCSGAKFKVQTKMLYIFFCFSVLGLISSLFAGDSFTFVLYPIINLFLAMLYAANVPIELFKKIYIRIVTIISFISILCGILYYIVPSLFQLFPVTVNTAGNGVYNLLLLVMPVSGNFRLQGFAWEAGVFQLLINFSLLFLITDNNWTRQNKRRLVILAVALVLTFSTTGYIVGLINVLLFLMRNYNGSVSHIKKVFLAIICIIILLYLVIPFIPTTINGVSFGLAKIQRFLQGVSTSTNMDSASVRFDSIYYPMKLFFQHPFIGAGYRGINSLGEIMHHTMTTCTIVNYFAMYGGLYGLLIIATFWKFAKRLTIHSMTAFLILAELLLVSFSEQLVNYLIIDILLFLSVSLKNKRLDDGEDRINEIINY